MLCGARLWARGLDGTERSPRGAGRGGDRALLYEEREVQALPPAPRNAAAVLIRSRRGSGRPRALWTRSRAPPAAGRRASVSPRPRHLAAARARGWEVGAPGLQVPRGCGVHGGLPGAPRRSSAHPRPRTRPIHLPLRPAWLRPDRSSHPGCPRSRTISKRKIIIGLDVLGLAGSPPSPRRNYYNSRQAVGEGSREGVCGARKCVGRLLSSPGSLPAARPAPAPALLPAGGSGRPRRRRHSLIGCREGE